MVAPTAHCPFAPAQVASGAFEVAPHGIASTDGASLLGSGLGATLYTRSIEPELTRKLSQAAALGAMTAVVCLEDSISEDEVAEAEDNVVAWLTELTRDGWDDLPLIFLRPRTPGQLKGLAERIGATGDPVVGVCLPKFTAAEGERWLRAVARAEEVLGHALLFMPIIESEAALGAETRLRELTDLRSLLHPLRQAIPAVRVGGSDLCGLLGLRRRIDQTMYELGPVAQCISDIVNVLGRGDDGFVVSGPVWEYFTADVRVWKPQLRETLFRGEGIDDDGAELRARLISSHFDGLIKEVFADQAHGLWGKTVIHPSHIGPVHALQAVSFEEWTDAQAVDAEIRSGSGGASKSAFANKMNETSPHRRWAARTLERAHVFGVLREGHTFVSLLDI